MVPLPRFTGQEKTTPHAGPRGSASSPGDALSHQERREWGRVGEETEVTMSENRLVGQKALVTGANSGIGKAVAIALGEAGAEVAVNWVSGEDAAQAVVEEIAKAGGKA